MIKTGLSPLVIFLPTIPGQFLCFSSSLFVHLCLNMLHLFCPFLFLILISPCGVSEGLCFVVAAFPGYPHLFFFTNMIIRASLRHSNEYPKYNYIFRQSTKIKH